jgi:hypothetical protein
MAHRLIWTAAAAVAMALVGSVSAQPQGGPTQDDVAHWNADQRAQYNAGFEKSTHDACVSSAQNHGAAADAAERYCSCVVDRLRPLSVENKVALSQHPDALSDASNACKAH